MEALVNEETGRFDAGKGRTEPERSDRVADTTAKDAASQDEVSAAAPGDVGAFRSRP